MYRSHLIHNLGLAALALLSLALPARAGSIPVEALPLPNRVATADMVIVGKVTGFEDKPVTAASFPGAKNKVVFTIATVTIGDALMAPKGTTTVRLGFIPNPPGVLINPPPFQPTVGLEGCFFLKKHGEADFLSAHGQLDFIDKKSARFDKDIALIKRCTTILEEPMASLKGKNAEDRFLAAGMLVARYNIRHSPNPTKEPIDAAESKLILQALAAADWSPSTDFTQLSPMMVLQRLPLLPTDGWAPPARTDPKEYTAYAQKWVTDHADSYRIQRFVAEKGK
jgi:hypothetical protein